MVLVIETSDLDAIHALSEVAKALKVNFRLESDPEIVSEDTRLQRIKVLKMFKGGLKKYASGYQPDKNEWYQQ